MSRADDLAIVAHDRLNAVGAELGDSAEEILEHGRAAVDRAKVALAAVPWCGGTRGLEAPRALDLLAAEPDERPTDPCPPPDRDDAPTPMVAIALLVISGCAAPPPEDVSITTDALFWCCSAWSLSASAEVEWCGQADTEAVAAGKAANELVFPPDGSAGTVIDPSTVSCNLTPPLALWDDEAGWVVADIGPTFDTPLCNFDCFEIVPIPGLGYVRWHETTIIARRYTSIPGQSAEERYSTWHFDSFGLYPGHSSYPWICVEIAEYSPIPWAGGAL